MSKYYHGSVRESPWYNHQNWKQYLGKELRFINYTRGNPVNPGANYRVPVPGRPWEAHREDEFCPRNTKVANDYWETLNEFREPPNKRSSTYPIARTPKSNIARPMVPQQQEHFYPERSFKEQMDHKRKDTSRSQEQPSRSHSTPPALRASKSTSRRHSHSTRGKSAADHGIKFGGFEHKRVRSSWYATLTSFPEVPGLNKEEIQKDWRRQTAPHGLDQVVSKLTARKMNTPKGEVHERMSKEVKGYLDSFGATSFMQLCARPCTRECDRKQGEQTAGLIQAAGRA